MHLPKFNLIYIKIDVSSRLVRYSMYQTITTLVNANPSRAVEFSILATIINYINAINYRLTD